MSEDIGYISYPDSEYTKAFSEKVEAKVDAEIQRIIKRCTEITKKMVAEHEQDIKK